MGRTPSGEDQEPRKQILRQNMEDFSLSMSSDSFNEEWLDLQDILTKDREKDLEEKNLGDLDFAGLYSIGTGHKGFERQPSYLEIFSEIESKDPLGTFNETTLFFNSYNNNISAKENNVVMVKQERTSRLTGYTHFSPSSPTDSWISTDDFPAELDELNEQFEIQLADKSSWQGNRWTPPSPSKRQRRRRRSRAMTVMRTTFLSTQNLQRGREGRRFWTQRKMTCLRTLTLTPRSLRRCQGPQRGGGNRRRRLQIMNRRSSRRKRSHRGTQLQGVTDARARIQFLSRGRREAR